MLSNLDPALKVPLSGRGLSLLLAGCLESEQIPEPTEKVAEHGQPGTGQGQSEALRSPPSGIFTTSAIWETHIECSTSFFFFFFLSAAH